MNVVFLGIHSHMWPPTRAGHPHPAPRARVRRLRTDVVDCLLRVIGASWIKIGIAGS